MPFSTTQRPPIRGGSGGVLALRLSRRTALKRALGTVALTTIPALTVPGTVRRVAAATFAPGDPVYVNTEALNLRTGPGLGSDVIRWLPYPSQGSVIEGPIAADGYRWYKVTMGGDGQEGWMAGEFLAYGSAAPGLPDPARFEVTAPLLNIRDGAGLGAAVVGRAAAGAQGRSLTFDSTPLDGYTWALVGFDDGQRGWIALEFVRWL